MKKLLLAVTFTLIATLGIAQDLIVTTNLDSIKCRITKVAPTQIEFSLWVNDENRITLLPTERIKSHEFGFYKSTNPEGRPADLSKPYKAVRFALSGGFSRRIAKMADGLDAAQEDHVNKLRNGYNLGADFNYFISESFGLGAKYSLYGSSNSTQIGLASISDDISILFVGASAVSRILDYKKQHALIMGLSLGMMKYTNNTSYNGYNGYNAEITGKTFSMAMDFGYDIKVSDDLAIGFMLSYTTGILNSLEVSSDGQTQKIDLETGEYENLSRIDLTIGVRF